jgi:hypothetical protein
MELEQRQKWVQKQELKQKMVPEILRAGLIPMALIVLMSRIALVVVQTVQGQLLGPSLVFSSYLEV